MRSCGSLRHSSLSCRNLIVFSRYTHTHTPKNNSDLNFLRSCSTYTTTTTTMTMATTSNTKITPTTTPMAIPRVGAGAGSAGGDGRTVMNACMQWCRLRGLEPPPPPFLVEPPLYLAPHQFFFTKSMFCVLQKLEPLSKTFSYATGMKEPHACYLLRCDLPIVVVPK